MLVKNFNKAWENERQQIEELLCKKLDEQMKDLKKAMNAPGYIPEDMRLSLNKMHNELVLRKGFAVFESEEIARNRMQLRSSYLAVVMSSVALIISVTTVLLKVW